MICPTDAQGNNADCSKAPHIVSNSWGGGQGETWFNDVIKAWNAAGIIGFFAIGNDVSERNKRFVDSIIELVNNVSYYFRVPTVAQPTLQETNQE